jgi:hypothetical protein
MSDVVIGDRLSFNNQFLLRDVSNLRCSWEVSRIGLLSLDVPFADLPAAAVPAQSLERRWIMYQHPTAGPWGGVISSVGVRDGIVTLDCESWAAMLRGVVSDGITATQLSVGVQQAINNSAAVTGVTWGSFAWPSPNEPDRYQTAEISPGAGFFANGQDLYNQFLPAVMDRLYDEHGWKSSLRTMGWNIDPATRQFFLDMTYGRDLTTTVALQDRVHNLSSGWTDDVEDLANVAYVYAAYNYVWQKPNYGNPPLIGATNGVAAHCTKSKYKTETKCKKGKGKWIAAVPGNPGTWGQAPIVSYTPTTVKADPTTIMAFNAESRNRYGPLTVFLSPDTVYDSKDAFEAAANQLVTSLSRNEQLVTIECADEGGVWAGFREGDIIRVELGNSGRYGNMVVRTRALDTTRGAMIVSGEANLA